MIGLDTNVLVRLLTADDTAQTAKVRRLLAAHEGDAGAFFINDLTLVETTWVLQRSYRLARNTVLAALADLLACDAYAFSNRELLQSVVAACQASALDFADVLIVEINRTSGCQHTVTFDKGLAMAGVRQL